MSSDSATANANAAAPASFPLLSLPPDALRSVLCRVPAADHDNLRYSCRNLRDAINSFQFRRERCLSGWAEVALSLPTREELMEKDKKDRAESDPDCSDDDSDEERQEFYGEVGRRDESYGYEDADARLWVDGKGGGEISFVLVPRDGHDTFHEATDAHSGYLQGVGWSYCDARGRPRLKSIRDVCGAPPSDSLGGFLYLKKMGLRPEYRANAGSTNVATDAIQALLCHERLASLWSLAVYLSDFREQLSGEDLARHERIEEYENKWFRPADAQEPSKEERELDERSLKESSVLDIRPFLRAGFKQVKEMASSDTNPYQVFAVPIATFSPLLSTMSHEDALAIPIAEPPVLPKAPSGADKELFDLVLKACNDRSGIPEYVRPPQVQQSLDELDEQEELITRSVENTLEEHSQVQEPQREELMRVVRSSVEPMFEAVREKINSLRSQLLDAEKEALAGISQIDDKVRDESARIVQEKGAKIASSHVLHCAAIHLVPEYVDLFLSLAPPEERGRIINGFDRGGWTPLMCAATAPMTTKNNPKMQYEFIDKLMGLGADRNVVSPADGNTALGCYWRKSQSSQDFINFVNVAPNESDSVVEWRERVERLLVPDFGPSPADKDLKSGDGSGDMAMDDGEDENEGEAMEEEGSEEEET